MSVVKGALIREGRLPCDVIGRSAVSRERAELADSVDGLERVEVSGIVAVTAAERGSEIE